MCAPVPKLPVRLQKMGFLDVFAYEGGTAEWKQKGFPLRDPLKKDIWQMSDSNTSWSTCRRKADGCLRVLKDEIENADKAGMTVLRNKIIDWAA